MSFFSANKGKLSLIRKLYSPKYSLLFFMQNNIDKFLSPLGTWPKECKQPQAGIVAVVTAIFLELAVLVTIWSQIYYDK